MAKIPVVQQDWYDQLVETTYQVGMQHFEEQVREWVRKGNSWSWWPYALGKAQ